ncbi:MAG: peptide deformylase [Micavibrio aeruginosavorus]|uniref:Peptide deformylase n=1 Tax=Micavibrio aeruginosavorus TaxID=349221 RepID=A0A7T5UHZ3_9BACT|nr:MAG: peptide deformylase [Micavibrio aeruginosavorus]
MDTYSIINIPHPTLKATAQPVMTVTDDVRRQMDRMLQTMYDAHGIGLAANQVNLLNRVFVMDMAPREGGDPCPVFVVNPEIVWRSEERSVMEEGCLSIPGQYAEVERPASVRLTYLDYHGEPSELLAEGAMAHCVQHELDHLNGVLFIDHISKLKRDMIVRKIEKLRKLGEIL